MTIASSRPGARSSAGAGDTVALRILFDEPLQSLPRVSSPGGLGRWSVRGRGKCPCTEFEARLNITAEHVRRLTADARLTLEVSHVEDVAGNEMTQTLTEESTTDGTLVTVVTGGGGIPSAGRQPDVQQPPPVSPRGPDGLGSMGPDGQQRGPGDASGGERTQALVWRIRLTHAFALCV
jgi:hypothetical protein